MSNNDRTDSNSSAEQKLTRALQALPRELAPERDLWPELAQQLPAQNKLVRAPLWGAVAVLTAVTLSFWLSLNTDTTPQLSAAPDYSSATNLALIYEQEKAAQLAQLNANSPSINRQLAIWDDAIEQVETALQYYPEQQQLLAQLNQLYQQQLRYIGEVSQRPPQIASLY